MNPKDLVQCFCLLFWLHISSAAQERLNDYIGKYEGLTYNTEALQASHSRARRSTASQTPNVHLHFNSHGRDFKLQLWKDGNTFVSRPEMELSDGSVVDLDTSHIYEGELTGDPGSYVHGSVIDGKFAGKIYTSNGGSYYVEKSELYFKGSQPFHSIIYHEDEVVEDHQRHKRSPLAGAGCGAANGRVQRWMDEVQNSAVEVEEEPIVVRSKREASSRRHNLYAPLEEAENIHAYHTRLRREASTKRTCTLFMQSDTELWNYMTRDEDRNGLEYDDTRAYEEITSLFASHVSGIKKIYEDTVFKSGALSYRGFTFVVRRVKINTTEDCEGGKELNNMFCKPNIDVSNFLNLNSLMNHDFVCLAYMFTYRDFTGGTLGLAWVGSPTKASGGICEKFKEYTENGRRIKKSLNTGIVTLVNYNARVPPKVSTLTFAHEVGHNFGSPHDSGPSCVPTTTDPSIANGNFIMFASATSGDRPNNSKFSTCSVSNVTLVVDAVLTTSKGKVNCFEESSAAFCGNAIVEENEECDCGFAEDCNKTDNCCYPNEGDNGDTTKSCRLKSDAKCSPSQGPCCQSDCEKVPLGLNKLCSKETECSDSAYCDGTLAACPQPQPKPDLSPCDDYTKVCKEGECSGSICERNEGWEQCYILNTENDKGFDKGLMCYVACKNPSTDKCVSTGDTDELDKAENQPLKDLLEEFSRDNIRLQPGAPCDNYRGYCDVFQKCRGVDADGPLARLKNLLFNQETFNTIKEWIITYWWAVLLMGLGLVICMGVFIHICAVHTPSSNPNAPKARKISLRPNANRNRQQGPPPAYVAGAPRQGPPPGRGRGPAAVAGSSQGASGGPPPYNQYEMKGQPPRV